MTAKEAFLKAIKGKEIYYFDNDRQLKLNGYFYDAESPAADDPRRTWRHVELCWCYPDIRNFKEDQASEVDRVETECKQYIADLTPEEVLQMFACYYKGKMPVPVVLDCNTVEELAAKGEDTAYIDAESLPEFPSEDCANNPDISAEIW